MPEMTDNVRTYRTLDAQMLDGDLVAPLSRWELQLVRDALDSHGRDRGIGYVQMMEQGFFFESNPYKEGSRRQGPLILGCPTSQNPSIGGRLVVFDYDDLRPEIQEAIKATLQKGELELRIIE